MASKQKKESFWHHHRIFLIILAVVVITLLVLISTLLWQQYQANQYQANLDPFYNTNGLNPNGPMGEVVRSEPLGVSVPNGTGLRILYRTQKQDGTATFSSGMVFIPSTPSNGQREVVAWAHGTIGMGDQCAPSRLSNPLSNIGWVSYMLARGWVVTATDYAGLGTAGTEGYLVGGDEARDVLNSVRAARNIAATQAGNRFGVWGHSQGGHSAIFTAQEASSYAPELRLVGTAATAPAAELGPLLQEQAAQPIDWVIGPEVMLSWPDNYSGLNVQDVLTSEGNNNYRGVAYKCIGAAAIEGIIRTRLNQQFFSKNLTQVPSWNAVLQAQTAPALKPSQPIFVGESLSDNVVLPNTTALYIQKSCQAGSNVSTLWLDQVNHIALQQVIAPAVIDWLGDRFAGRANQSNCNQPLPITPASNVN